MKTEKLSNTAPLLFLWIPRERGFTLPEQYKENMLKWGNNEPQRDIYLIVNGNGFTREQFKNLTKTLKQNKIFVQDFNKLNLEGEDFSFPINEQNIKISDYYRDMYSSNFKRMREKTLMR